MATPEAGPTPDSSSIPYGREPLSGAHVVAHGLARQFGDHRALKGVDLEIQPGESFGLLGANGAGKTTFIRLVTGFLVPSAGEVTVDDFSPTDNPRAAQARIGFVSESARLYPELRVHGYLKFAGGIRGLSGASLTRAVDDVLDRFDLSDVRTRRIGNLSKGFQQRVSLAQAFLHQPGLLIADEPTSGLDPLQRSDVHAQLESLRGQHTLLLCTHDLDEARALTDRAAILYQGQLVALGPTEEVLADGQSLDLFRGHPHTDDQP
jgi:ABC-2 type transport system ATP-binding protein